MGEVQRKRRPPRLLEAALALRQSQRRSEQILIAVHLQSSRQDRGMLGRKVAQLHCSSHGGHCLPAGARRDARRLGVGARHASKEG